MTTSNRRKTLTILAVAVVAQLSVTANAQQVPRSPAQARAAESSRPRKPIRIILRSEGQAASPIRLDSNEVLAVLSSADATPEHLARLVARARVAEAAGTRKVNGATVRLRGTSTDALAPSPTDAQRQYYEQLLTRLRAAKVRSSTEHGLYRQLVLRPVSRGNQP